MSSATGTDNPRSLLDYLRLTEGFLAGKGIDSPRLDSELLLASVLGMTRVQLYTSFERPLSREEVDAYRALVRRRAAREPVAYILGRREFWSLEIEVDRRVLVPRPETELLVEQALQILRARVAAGADAVRVADVGTGSGAIAVAIAKEIPQASVVATDRSEAALEVAPRNACRHGVEGRIEWVSGDLLTALSGRGAFDLIVANPPYIRSGEVAALPPEVRDWEPRMALVAGEDGMDSTRPLVLGAPELLAPGGWLAVEVGTQAGLVRQCFEETGYADVRVVRDLAGTERVVAGRRS
ncbi:MAG TPA: peptide chain release factor N(5)-glutamine methyltransferase [Candidatus Limnocylindrales bacterium]|nr:peptide chain release factor N(5)-glutamine methyltransferase [Candidatus Limnocylindrales bacterium]